MRRNEDYVVWRVLEKEFAGKRRRGSPRRGWIDCIKEALTDKELEERDVTDGSKWRRHRRSSDLISIN